MKSPSKNKKYSPELKFKVALEAVRGEKSVNEICHEYEVAPAQVYAWKKILEENGARVFNDKRKPEDPSRDIERLHAIIGHLTVEKERYIKTSKR